MFISILSITVQGYISNKKKLTSEQEPITGTPAHKFLSPIKPKQRTSNNKY